MTKRFSRQSQKRIGDFWLHECENRIASPQAKEFFEEEKLPDVALIDINMPGLRIQLLEFIKTYSPETECIMSLLSTKPRVADDCLKKGL